MQITEKQTVHDVRRTKQKKSEVLHELKFVNDFPMQSILY